MKQNLTEATTTTYPDLQDAAKLSWDYEQDRKSLWREDRFASSLLNEKYTPDLTSYYMRIIFMATAPIFHYDLSSEFHNIPGWKKTVENTDHFSRLAHENEIEGMVLKSQQEHAEFVINVAGTLKNQEIKEFGKKHIVENNGETHTFKINIVTTDGTAIDCRCDLKNHAMSTYFINAWIKQARNFFTPDTTTGQKYNKIVIVIPNSGDDNSDINFGRLQAKFNTELQKPENRDFSGKIKLHSLSSFSPSSQPNLRQRLDL